MNLKLELGYIKISDIQLSNESKVENGVLYVNPEDIINLIEVPLFRHEPRGELYTDVPLSDSDDVIVGADPCLPEDGRATSDTHGRRRGRPFAL